MIDFCLCETTVQSDERYRLMMRISVLISLLIYGLIFVTVITAAEGDQGQVSGQSQQEQVKEPALWLESKEIDLGIILPEQTTIVGAIHFMNEGAQPLEIRKVSGPCACFAGWSGDKLLEPGAGGVIEVKFDKAKIPESGRVRRLVRIDSNDPKQPQAEMYFAFTIERSDAEEIHLLRTELAQIRKELQLLREDVKKLLAQKSSNPSAPVAATARTPEPPDTKIYDIAIGDSPIRGKADAPVTIVMFSDFQCPFCTREKPKLDEVLKNYPDKVRLVYKHFPLSFHKQAKPVHAAAQLALKEKGPDAFWKFHDWILADSKALDIPTLRTYAERLGLNLTNFDETLKDDSKMDALLKPDMDQARACGVRGTPTILINGLKMASRNPEDYKSRIEQILSPKPAAPVAVKP
jgi:protein-disulfide isomerase